MRIDWVPLFIRREFWKVWPPCREQNLLRELARAARRDRVEDAEPQSWVCACA